MIKELALIMFTAVLIENFIFYRFYGCCPFLGVSEKPSTALGMGFGRAEKVSIGPEQVA